MQIYRFMLLYWKVVRANRTLRIVLLLMAAALTISQPWYASDPYETIYSGTSWFYLTSGLIAGFLILCWNIYDISGKQGVIISIGKRSDIAVDIFLLVLMTAVISSIVYMIIFYGAAVCFSGSMVFPLMSPLMSAVLLGIYVCFCGMCFFIIAEISDRPAAAFLTVIMFPGADFVCSMIKGSPLLLKYVFPPETLLHVGYVTFITGGAVLTASALLVFIVFAAVIARKDFISGENGKNE